MGPRHPTGLRIASGITGVLLLLVAISSFLWGVVFCLFLGGPEGDRGSPDSIVWGTGFVVFAVILAAVAALLLKVATKAFPMRSSSGQP